MPFYIFFGTETIFRKLPIQKHMKHGNINKYCENHCALYVHINNVCTPNIPSTSIRWRLIDLFFNILYQILLDVKICLKWVGNYLFDSKGFVEECSRAHLSEVTSLLQISLAASVFKQVFTILPLTDWAQGKYFLYRDVWECRLHPDVLIFVRIHLKWLVGRILAYRDSVTRFIVFVFSSNPISLTYQMRQDRISNFVA
jgi:hypothetical protein